MKINLQILNNLIINSITAFGNETEYKKIYVHYGFENDNVIIEVLDNACKIPDELSEKVFEMHYSTTGGSGIGLAHAKHLLDILNGSIKLISSDEEYCTKFVVKFPIKSNG